MDYTNRTLLEWDDKKNNHCLKSRGFDFSFAAKAFLDPQRIIFLDERNQYDEEVFRQEAIEHLRDVRTKLGFSQTEFAKLLNVFVTSIRNWEQGKRFPTGAARALYKILDKQPKAAMAALVENHDLVA